MAKSTNHTNHNQNKKAHRRGIKKDTRQRYASLKGCDPKFLRNRRRSQKMMNAKRFEASKWTTCCESNWFINLKDSLKGNDRGPCAALVVEEKRVQTVTGSPLLTANWCCWSSVFTKISLFILSVNINYKYKNIFFIYFAMFYTPDFVK